MELVTVLHRASLGVLSKCWESQPGLASRSRDQNTNPMCFLFVP